MVKIMENPTKMDDLRGTPIFGKMRHPYETKMCLKPIKLTIFMTEFSVPPKLLAPSNYKQNMLCGRDDMRRLGPFGWLDRGIS